jgi:hypothetical protein
MYHGYLDPNMPTSKIARAKEAGSSPIGWDWLESLWFWSGVDFNHIVI